MKRSLQHSQDFLSVLKQWVNSRMMIGGSGGQILNVFTSLERWVIPTPVAWNGRLSLICAMSNWQNDLGFWRAEMFGRPYFLFLLLRHERVQPIRYLLPYPELEASRASERLLVGLEHSRSPSSEISIKNQTTSLNISNRQSRSWTLCWAQLRTAFI